MKIIAISGHAQNGKDTVAKMLEKQLFQNNRVLIAHYADLLKYICKTFFEWDGKKDEKGRSLLQFVGTDVVREQAPDFWVDFLIDVFNLFEDCWDFVIIPDARFPNEIDKLREYYFDVTHLRVTRGNFKSPLSKEQLRHPSETALDCVKPDYFIVNNGSLEELKNKVSSFIKEALYV